MFSSISYFLFFKYSSFISSDCLCDSIILFIFIFSSFAFCIANLMFKFFLLCYSMSFKLFIGSVFMKSRCQEKFGDRAVLKDKLSLNFYGLLGNSLEKFDWGFDLFNAPFRKEFLGWLGISCSSF